MRTTVVIPTYNERENIKPLIDAILSLDVTDTSILVVDDSSPDGTGDIVRTIAQDNPHVSLLTREKKEGLGKAYIAGFRRAIMHGAEAIIQMDADFSHDPHDIPRFLNALRKADLVIGSRYIQGGKVSDWVRWRRWLSQYANIYARIVTGVPVSDLTGGFKAWRTSLLQKINFSEVSADGYGFQIEMNSRAFFCGARIEEIPIVFEDRRVGQSKISKDIIWEALWLVWKIRFQRKSLSDRRSEISTSSPSI